MKFCYDSFDPDPSDEQMNIVINSAMHELLHILGFKDTDFPFYYDINSGLPRTPRPIETKEVQCTDGSIQSILFPSEDTIKRGITSYGVIYYSVVTPRVQQTVRNQFDCEEMDGARLENQPKRESCLGDDWEEVRK